MIETMGEPLASSAGVNETMNRQWNLRRGVCYEAQVGGQIS